MNESASLQLSDIFDALPEIASLHARSTKTYRLLEIATRNAVLASGLLDKENRTVNLGHYGNLVFPYTKMGAIDSLDLFGLDEMLIFAFYWANRDRYKNAADIGANIGLHSILMSKCGWRVRSFEPDPVHASLLRRNLSLNGVTSVELVEAAVSDKPGKLEFVRVLGNTTSSHLAGSKPNPYGELERFPVRVEPITAILPSVDFIKMDAEGQEKTMILKTTSDDWQRIDMMVEVGSVPNAEAIYAHLQSVGVNAYAQKLGWARVASLSDMPTTYKDGSLFISHLPAMPWGATNELAVHALASA